MKYLVLVAIVVVYSVLGKCLQDYEIIVKPAYWAFYGYVFGFIAATYLARVN